MILRLKNIFICAITLLSCDGFATQSILVDSSLDYNKIGWGCLAVTGSLFICTVIIYRQKMHIKPLKDCNKFLKKEIDNEKRRGRERQQQKRVKIEKE